MTNIRTGHRNYRYYLPKSQGTGSNILMVDQATRTAAAISSRGHLKALLTYGIRNGGLPNMSVDMCRAGLMEME